MSFIEKSDFTSHCQSLLLLTWRGRTSCRTWCTTWSPFCCSASPGPATSSGSAPSSSSSTTAQTPSWSSPSSVTTSRSSRWRRLSSVSSPVSGSSQGGSKIRVQWTTNIYRYKVLPLPHPGALLHHPRRGGVHRHVSRLLHLQLSPDNPPVPKRDVDSPHSTGTLGHNFYFTLTSQYYLRRLRWQVWWKEIARTSGVTRRIAPLRKKMRRRKSSKSWLYSFNDSVKVMTMWNRYIKLFSR